MIGIEAPHRNRPRQLIVYMLPFPSQPYDVPGEHVARLVCSIKATRVHDVARLIEHISSARANGILGCARPPALPEVPPINFTKFIDALSPIYRGFYRVLWRILSLEYGWIIAGLSENYGENYGEIIKILLLNYCSVAIILEHAGTGLELVTSWNPALGARNRTHVSLKKCPDRGSNP